MGVESWTALRLRKGGSRRHSGVDELERAQAALTRTEARFGALMQASASVVWRAAPDGAIIEICHWNRYPSVQDAALANGWLALLHPDDRERVAASWQASVASATMVPIEYRIAPPGRSYRWVRATAVPVRGTDGTIEEWVGTLTDIHERKVAEEELRSREERYRLAARATKDAIWDWDLVTDEIAWGEAANELFGRALGDLGSMNAWWEDNIHRDDRDRVAASIGAVVQGTQTYWSDEYRFRRGDGTYAEILDRGFVIRAETGAAVRMVGAMQDVSGSRIAEAALRASEERLRLALHAGRMFAWERDLATDFVTRSESARELIGLGSGPAWEFASRVHADDRERAPAVLRGVWEEDTGHNELRYLRPDGNVIWLAARSVEVDEPGKPKRLIGVTFDITERKKAEAEVWRLANEDPLTALPNRMRFHVRFERALDLAQRNGTTVSLLLIDLDNFKDVNDTLGHDAGDALLREIARRLRNMARDCDTVARVGGDEFAMLVVEPLTLDHAVRFAEHVLESIRTPFAYAGRLLAGKASIGIAAFPDHEATVPDLLKDADIALYRAKTQGRNRVVAYAPEMRAAMEQRVRISAEIQGALGAGQIVPFYQPKVCLSSGQVIGFEALARWQHPEKGVLTPGYFGVAFEDPDLAELIGDAIIRHVAGDVGQWLSAGLDCGRVAVNLSSAEFGRPDLAEGVLQTLKRAGIPTANFEVEVTETVLLGASSERVAEALKRFRAAGVTVALDDFGTGYASLTHLKQFPVNHIKIDQSFVRGLGTSGHDEAIVAAVIGLGKSLQMQVVAEGVETQEQAAWLERMGCDVVQGYLYGKPMVASRVPWLLAEAKQAQSGAAEASRTEVRRSGAATSS
jgi:diguanylate cyclase (GGDEF)-like protein/PAS domain S-box-containing protein